MTTFPSKLVLLFILNLNISGKSKDLVTLEKFWKTQPIRLDDEIKLRNSECENEWIKRF